jgi:hypothetical protein
MNLKRFIAVLLMMFFAAAINLSSQTLTTGDITGSVTDPSGAIVPNAPVSAKNTETGAEVNTATGSSGAYRFTLLKPGNYLVVVQMAGFAKVEQMVAVNVGQASVANVSLSIKKGEQTVEVTAAVPVIGTNSSVNTSFSEQEVHNLPSAGGDITNIADTAPGVVVNNITGGGYGNFTVNGMPATSNLFTVNGENDMDPYFNINNSGATNLTLGANELQEATVVSNPYGAEYGQLAGAQISYVTKSGTNSFHGNAQYWWNGRAMNSNDWFNRQSGNSVRPFSNANQWASSIGGPIRKNSTFFFVDFEGLRFLLPNVDDISTPTPAFAAAVEANVAALEPNETATYTQMFNLYSSAPGASTAVAQTPAPDSGCANINTPTSSSSSTQLLPGWVDGTPCVANYTATPSALAHEWILSARVDQKLGNNDNLFFRWKTDKGLQPTTIDPISSSFDANSNQPAYDAQLNETHAFGPNSTNSFTASLSHYVAQFTQNQPLAFNTFPFALTIEGDIGLTGFNPMESFPQGRNITQYQFIDDFTWSHGKHNFKFGENFRRYDVSDHNFFFNYPRAVFNDMDSFVQGLALEYERSDNLESNVPVALWGIGAYVQDEWSVKPNLKVTLALRAEHSSNPVCQINCFADFVSPTATLPSFALAASGGDPTTVPYNAANGGDIVSGLHKAYHGVDAIDWSPRVSFSWSPRASNTLVISGGFGIFSDSPAAGLVDDLLGDPPASALLRVKNPAAGGVPVFDTTSPTGPQASFFASSAAFNNGFATGQTFTQISAATAANGVVFQAPAFTDLAGTIHAPIWYEWNFQVQKQIGRSMAIQVNYVGNHGTKIPYTNSWANAYDPFGLYEGLLPENAPPVPNYANVNQVQNGGISNYDGLELTYKGQYGHLISFHLNYTYSHNLDEVSNGGLFTIGDSILGQICPASLRSCNYGNSDYDIRHLVNGDFVVTPSFRVENAIAKQVVNGWQISTKYFWRTGLPFSVGDDNWQGAIFDGGSTIFAQPIAGTSGQAGSCGGGAASFNGSATPCLNAAGFINSASPTFEGYPTFSSQVRNQYRGPHYFDMDLALFKTFNIKEKATLGIGAQAFNVFNHPNFGLPDNAIGDTTFGQISSMANTPTSPYGNFLGFDSSIRVVQLSAKLNF